MRKILLSIITCCVCSCYAFAGLQGKEQDCRNMIDAGNRLLWRFEPAEAWVNYHQALKMAKEAGSEYLYAEALLGVGQALWYVGRFNEAADTVKLSIKHYRYAHAVISSGSALRILSNIYDDQGDYENAFKTVNEALTMFQSRHNNHNYVLSLVQMGALYTRVGDYTSALEYFRKAEAQKPYPGEYPYREMNHRIGEMYATQGDINMARVYYRKALFGNSRSKLVRLRLGDTYLQEGNYDVAFRYYDSLHKEAVAIHDTNVAIWTMLGLAKVYLVRHDLPHALEMVNGSLEQSSLRGDRKNKRDAYKILSAIYEADGKGLLALQFHKQYEALKDSVISEDFKRKLFAYTQESEAEKLKGQRDKLVAGIVGVVLLGFFIVFIITLRHKNEKLHLSQRASELEMKALRAQMNPHFIFNCLTAINHFILNNEGDKASDYLTRFSKLMRMVLVNAGKTTITLEEEVAMLQLYLNMEQLRFKEVFDYEFSFENGVHPSMIWVPSFILQPFCENAIWHGLLHKDGPGELKISFWLKKEVLYCTITDNGIGRARAAALNTGTVEKISSFGNRLSAERLALYNSDESGASFVMEDVLDDGGAVAGTKVILKINNQPAHD